MKRCLLLAAIAAALQPGTAAARRIAYPNETQALTAGIRIYTTTSGCCAIGRFRITAAWISTVNPDFAVAKVAASEPSGGPGPHATAVLVHTHSGRWTVIALGTAKLACGLNPRIRHDLHLPRCA